MRVDLHNYIPSKTPKGLFSRYLFPKKDSPWDIHKQAIQYHGLDAFAVTNPHEIDLALALAQKYPSHVIVGCEYQVLAPYRTTAQIVVLGQTKQQHNRLMAQRLHGLKSFVKTLKNYGLRYFLVHLGWGLSENHPKVCEVIESYAEYFYAVEVLSIHQLEQETFATNIARYYNIHSVAGSVGPVANKDKRAYTEIEGPLTIADFLEALPTSSTKVAFTETKKPIKLQPPLFAFFESNNYIQELRSLWQSEVVWDKETAKRVQQTLFTPTLKWLPEVYFRDRWRNHQKKMKNIQKQFVDYLVAKETQQLFTTPSPKSSSVKAWEKNLQKIYDIF